jgi:L-iditol 2-dehydrogenase
VKHLKPGDRVKCDSVVGCGKCEWCQRGATQFCPDGWEFGITRDGGWADWLVAPARNLRKLPAEISDEVAAIMDVEVYGALRKPGVRSGETIAILGAGPAGLIGLQVARLLGAGRVILCGTRPERLELAKRLGADEVIDSRACDANEAVKDLTGGLGVDLAMDAAGTDLAIQQAIRMVRPQGRVVLYGVLGHAMRDFPSDEIVLKDLILYGALPDRTGWEEFIEWVASGQLDLASLITHRFPLEQAGEALRFMRDRKEGAIKAVLRISGAEGIPAETASASLKQSQLGPGAC